MQGWCVHVQGLVRAFIVIGMHEPVEGLLLGCKIVFRFVQNILFQGQVDAFMAAVLSGFTGLDAFGCNAQLDKPDQSFDLPYRFAT